LLVRIPQASRCLSNDRDRDNTSSFINWTVLGWTFSLSKLSQSQSIVSLRLRTFLATNPLSTAPFKITQNAQAHPTLSKTLAISSSVHTHTPSSVTPGPTGHVVRRLASHWFGLARPYSSSCVGGLASSSMCTAKDLRVLAYGPHDTPACEPLVRACEPRPAGKSFIGL